MKCYMILQNGDFYYADDHNAIIPVGFEELLDQLEQKFKKQHLLLKPEDFFIFSQGYHGKAQTLCMFYQAMVVLEDKRKILFYFPNDITDEQIGVFEHDFLKKKKQMAGYQLQDASFVQIKRGSSYYRYQIYDHLLEKYANQYSRRRKRNDRNESKI